MRRGSRLAPIIGMSKGFSLVEVLIALSILLGAIVTLAMVMERSAFTNASARRITYATLLATDKIEHLRALPFDDAGLTTSAADTLATDCEGFFDEPSPGYRRRWSIVPLTGMDAVVVTVAVSFSGGSPQAFLTTLKVRRAA
jgi:prepilin-type N-terminal cleavage/methylation domain-containing protein